MKNHAMCQQYLILSVTWAPQNWIVSRPCCIHQQSFVWSTENITQLSLCSTHFSMLKCVGVCLMTGVSNICTYDLTVIMLIMFTDLNSLLHCLVMQCNFFASVWIKFVVYVNTENTSIQIQNRAKSCEHVLIMYISCFLIVVSILTINTHFNCICQVTNTLQVV